MGRQRIEQLVRVDGAVNVFRERGCAMREQGGVRPERRDLCIARWLRLFNERKPDGGVEVVMMPFGCVENIAGKATVARTDFDEIERQGLEIRDLGLGL